MGEKKGRSFVYKSAGNKKETENKPMRLRRYLLYTQSWKSVYFFISANNQTLHTITLKYPTFI